MRTIRLAQIVQPFIHQFAMCNFVAGNYNLYGEGMTGKTAKS